VAVVDTAADEQLLDMLVDVIIAKVAERFLFAFKGAPSKSLFLRMLGRGEFPILDGVTGFVVK